MPRMAGSAPGPGALEEIVKYRSTARSRSRRRISVLAAAAALGASGVMLGAGSASAATSHAEPAHVPGLFTRITTVYVPATTTPTSAGLPGVDTGVALLPGEPAVITAAGTASCITGYLPCTDTADGGPVIGGPQPFFDLNAPSYSLVGEAGDGPVTFVGTGPTKVRGPGELRLQYNDASGAYGDNDGGFTATIRTCSLYGVPVVGPSLCGLLGLR